MKSISKAAQYLHVTQPTLSLRLRKTEEGLGFPLFERDWQGVKLTKQGAYFLPYAVQLLQGVESATIVLSDYINEKMRSYEEVTNRENCLYIGIDTWLHPLFMTKITELLDEKYPELRYRFITRSSQTIFELLDVNGIHLGIFYKDGTKTLKSERLVNDEMVLLYKGEERITIRDDLSNIDELNHKPFILFDNPILTYHSHITKAIINQFSIEKFHIVDDYNVMLNFISTGNSYTVIPKSSILPFLQTYHISLQIVPLGDRIPKKEIHLAYSETNEQFIEPIQHIATTLHEYMEAVYEKV